MDVAKPARRLKGSVVTRLRRATERRGADGSRRSSAPLRLLERAGGVPVLGPWCLRWAGFMHAAEGRFEPAIADYEAARDAGLGGDASLHCDLGRSLLRAGRPERAATLPEPHP
jgi:hypothetical protein